MCFVVIAIPQDFGESAPILVDKYPTQEQALEVQADLELQNKTYHDKFAEYYDQTKPQTATELNITDAARYREYCKELTHKRNELLQSIVIPRFVQHDIFVL